MKRILFFIAMMFCVGIISAQDVISLRNGSTIEGVTIISITNEKIIYSQDGHTVSIPHNSAEAILYADGRYETITNTIVGDSAAMARVADLGYDAYELQAMLENGEDRKMLLWQDEAYPANCRKKKKKIYYKVFKELYNPALKEAKRNGLSQSKAMQEAMEEVFPKAMRASNEAVRECNGGM